MAVIISGKEVSAKVRAEVKAECEQLKSLHIQLNRSFSLLLTSLTINLKSTAFSVSCLCRSTLTKKQS